MAFRKLIIHAVLAAFVGLSITACSVIGESKKESQSPAPAYNEKYSRLTSLLAVMFQHQSMPDGLNQWGCKPALGKSNIILVHGTFSSTMLSYGALGPRLANNGYCVYARDFGSRDADDWFKGMESVDKSAREIGVFVDKIIRSSGEAKVDLIGHSQGGLIGFYLIKELGYQDKINRFIALAPSIGGTTLATEPEGKAQAYCKACADQHPDSNVIRRLHDGPVTRPGVKYTVLATKNDYVVRPVEKQFIQEPGVSNLYILDRIPGKFTTHSNMLYDDEVLNLIISLLDQ